MKLIVGLGNPGRAYSHHRHNVGFRCVDYLARQHGIALQRRSLYHWGQAHIAGVEVVLAKPRTYMNLSGRAVAALARTWRLSPGDILVIHDDLDLPLGRLRLRQGGGAAGHRGVASVIAALGRPAQGRNDPENRGLQDFPRLRVGIGRPADVEGLSLEAKAEAVIAYVLSDFTPEEETAIQEAVARAAEAVACFLAEGLATAMDRYNRTAPG